MFFSDGTHQRIHIQVQANLCLEIGSPDPSTGKQRYAFHPLAELNIAELC
jgi:hypothetical protein